MVLRRVWVGVGWKEGVGGGREKGWEQYTEAVLRQHMFVTSVRRSSSNRS